MDPKLTRDTAARVVAWHNRHPLARRIRPEQVGSVGVVGLPFTPRTVEAADAAPEAVQTAATGDDPAAPAGRLAGWRRRLGSLWLRLRRAEPGAPSPWQAAFDEPFLPGFDLTATQRWAEDHAVDERPGSEEAPQRLVPPREALLAQDLAAGIEAALGEPTAGAASGAAAPPWTQRWVLAAALDAGGARHRLLLAPDSPKVLLGRRALAPGRIAVATGLLAGVLTLAVLAPWLGGHGATGKAAHAAAAAASAGSAPAPAGHASAAAATASAPSGAAAHADITHAPDAHAPAAEAKAAETAGHGETAHGDAAASSPQGPHADGSDGEPGHAPAQAPAPVHPTAVAPDAAHAGGHTPAAPPAPERHGSPHDAPAQAPATPRAPAAARGDRPGTATPPATLPAKGPVFALATRASPVRAEAEALRRRMQAAAATLAEALPGTQVELLQRGERWSAVWWPFADREAATQARWALALKGVTVDVVEF